MRLLLFLVLPFLLHAFQALPEHLPYYALSTEKTLETEYKHSIEPHFARGIEGHFQGENNVSIFYMLFPVLKEKGAIVIANGRTEAIIKYKELIYDLNYNGYSVYLLDHRGQGFSGRMVKDVQMGYVEDFNNYVLDLHSFVVSTVKPLKSKHLYLLGHSMGGAIAARYLEMFNDGFDAAVLNSPMLQPNLFTANTSGLICKVMRLEKKQAVYAPGQTSYDLELSPFKNNLLTHSKRRFSIMREEMEEHPSAKIGGPSIGWIQQACIGSELAVENADKIEMPLLILRGSEDEIVNPKAEDEFCQKLGSKCIGYEIKGAWHELLIERDTYREEALSVILTFLDLVREDTQEEN